MSDDPGVRWRMQNRFLLKQRRYAKKGRLLFMLDVLHADDDPSVVRLQTTWRARFSQKQLHNAVRAACKLQSVARGGAQRRRAACPLRAATVLQSAGHSHEHKPFVTQNEIQWDPHQPAPVETQSQLELDHISHLEKPESVQHQVQHAQLVELLEVDQEDSLGKLLLPHLDETDKDVKALYRLSNARTLRYAEQAERVALRVLLALYHTLHLALCFVSISKSCLVSALQTHCAMQHKCSCWTRISSIILLMGILTVHSVRLI
mmetsp:Transcript_72722/g.121371  ORF Transcript_72722/g.121371 Transcript_72722/m.121371 type:complete len:262 (-) Transcript_72722:375-1160(-)|eukprot:CAMPEP_0119319426 /NCGR_PEP_ID=MMETSP1333-20130426/49328_1 /TAXON_ID=418940 /ORGANISM="Scyphosphaera apsteinii, Strain RCC1455" /LENGTH=261 /DNA_ID=CAMNT_0007325829 /DNA_START=60 /DNA_END=845 /DNA_ORIENTATION=+